MDLKSVRSGSLWPSNAWVRLRRFADWFEDGISASAAAFAKATARQIILAAS